MFVGNCLLLPEYPSFCLPMGWQNGQSAHVPKLFTKCRCGGFNWYTPHGLGPYLEGNRQIMWVLSPTIGTKRKRVALQAGAPALGAGPFNAMEVQVPPRHHSSIQHKTAPDFQGGFVFHPFSDARRTLLAQSTSDEERAIEIQPGSRREFGISRMPRTHVGNAQLNPKHSPRATEL